MDYLLCLGEVLVDLDVVVKVDVQRLLISLVLVHGCLIYFVLLVWEIVDVFDMDLGCLLLVEIWSFATSHK